MKKTKETSGWGNSIELGSIISRLHCAVSGGPAPVGKSSSPLSSPELVAVPHLQDGRRVSDFLKIVILSEARRSRRTSNYFCLPQATESESTTHCLRLDFFPFGSCFHFFMSSCLKNLH